MIAKNTKDSRKAIKELIVHIANIAKNVYIVEDANKINIRIVNVRIKQGKIQGKILKTGLWHNIEGLTIIHA